MKRVQIKKELFSTSTSLKYAVTGKKAEAKRSVLRALKAASGWLKRFRHGPRYKQAAALRLKKFYLMIYL